MSTKGVHIIRTETTITWKVEDTLDAKALNHLDVIDERLTQNDIRFSSIYGRTTNEIVVPLNHNQGDKELWLQDLIEKES